MLLYVYKHQSYIYKIYLINNIYLYCLASKLSNVKFVIIVICLSCKTVNSFDVHTGYGFHLK